MAGAEGPALLQGWQTPIRSQTQTRCGSPSGALRSHGPADQEARRKNKMRETHGGLLAVCGLLTVVVSAVLISALVHVFSNIVIARDLGKSVCPSTTQHHPPWEQCLTAAPVPARRARARSARAQACVCVCVCKGRSQPCQPCECDKHKRNGIPIPACHPACGIDVRRGCGQTEQAVTRPKPATGSPSSFGFETRNNGPFLTTSAGFTSLGTGATVYATRQLEAERGRRR